MFEKILEIKEKAERDLIFAKAKLEAISEILSVITPTEVPVEPNEDFPDESASTPEVSESADFNTI